jgi:hypothetical protein
MPSLQILELNYRLMRILKGIYLENIKVFSMGWVTVHNLNGELIKAYGDVPDRVLYGDNILKRENIDKDGNEMGSDKYLPDSFSPTTNFDDPEVRKEWGLK